jgi:hypothetical protein
MAAILQTSAQEDIAMADGFCQLADNRRKQAQGG